LRQLLFSKETRRREPFRGNFSAVPAQIVLLAGEQRLTAPAIAASVREANQTVRNWLKCWMAKGIEGLKDRPMEGTSAENQ
jgi:hypothetical protein